MAETNLRPNSDEVTNWNVRIGGSDHYAEVDETSQDGDSTYVYGSAIGSDVTDRFGLTSWPEGDVTISKVEVVVWAKKTSGSPTVTPFLYLSASTSNGSADSPGSSYAEDKQEISRPGGGSWDYTDLASLEVGIKYNGSAKADGARVTQVYVIVTWSGAPTEDTERLGNIVIPDKKKVSRLAQAVIADKMITTRLANIAEPEPASLRLTNMIPFAAFDPTWWNNNYFKRQKIGFGTSHSLLGTDYTAEFDMTTGYGQEVATNAIGPLDMRRYNGVTYAFWIAYPTSGNLRIYARKYTHSTATWSDAVNVCDAGHAYDTHYYPALLIDSSGYLHIFYGCHNSNLKYRKSTNSEDITAWGSEATIGAGVGSTYPRPVKDSSGNLYVFVRKYASPDGYMGFFKSTNGGTSWGSFQTVVDYSDNYGGNSSVYTAGVVIDSQDRCHLAIVWHDYYLGDNKGRGITYVYSDTMSTWKYIDGTTAGQTEVSAITYDASECVVTSPSFPSAGPYYGANDDGLVVDANQYPYFLYSSWTTQIREEAKYYLAKWTGSAWSTIELSNLAGSPPKLWTSIVGHRMYLHNNDLHIYGIVLPPGGTTYFAGELYKWRGNNLGSTWAHYYMTMESGGGVGGVYTMPEVSDGGQREVAVIRNNVITWMEDKHYPYVRDDGADVRVVLHQDGQADIELDRLPDLFQHEATEISFPINVNAPVPANKAHPHAYKGYWTYYGYYNASNPPNDEADVWPLYESFEEYATGSDLNSAADWSGDASIFTVCSSHDTSTHSEAHINKLWSGNRFIFVDDPGAKSITRTLSLNNHYIEFHIIAGADFSTGEKAYIELYDSGSSKYFRFGIQYNKFSYMKSGGSWTDTAQTADTLRFHTFRMLINSNGVSLWGDGTSLLTNDNHITQCTSIKIGCDITTGVAYYDEIKAWQYVSDVEETALESVEGTDNSATTRLANLPDIRYFRDMRLASDLDLMKVAILIIANALDLDKETTERLANRAPLIKEDVIRLAQIISGDKQLTTRLAHDIVPDAQAYIKVANFLATDKELTARMMHDLNLDKIEISRISNDLNLDKETIIRLMNIAVLDKKDIERLSNKVDIRFFRSIRIVHAIATDKEVTHRLAHAISLATPGSERLANILDLDKETTFRLMGLIVPDKETVERLANYLDTDKELTTRLANILNVDVHETTRLAHAVIADKTVIIRLANDLEGDKVVLERLAHIIALIAEDSSRLANIADLDKIEVLRLASTVIPDKETIIRLAGYLDTDKEFIARLANLADLEAADSLRIAHAVSTDKNLTTRLANKLSADKELTSRLAHFIDLATPGIERLANILDLDKETILRLAGTVVLDKETVERLAHYLDTDKELTARLAHDLDLEDIDTLRIAHEILTDKNLVIRLSNTAIGYKTVMQRLMNVIPLEATIAARLACWCDLEASSFLRISNYLDLDKEETARLANLIDFEGTVTIRLANILDLNKITTIRLPNIISLESMVLARIAMSAVPDKELESRLAQTVSLEAEADLRLSNLILGNKILTSRVANALALNKITSVRVAHYIDVMKINTLRLANGIFFAGMPSVIGFRFDGLALDTFELADLILRVLKLSDLDIDTLDLSNLDNDVLKLSSLDVDTLDMDNLTIN